MAHGSTSRPKYAPFATVNASRDLHEGPGRSEFFSSLAAHSTQVFGVFEIWNIGVVVMDTISSESGHPGSRHCAGHHEPQMKPLKTQRPSEVF